MKIVLIDCGSRRCRALEVALQTRGPAVTVIPLAEVLTREAELHDAEAAVISGGPRLFTSEPDLLDQFAFIDRLSVPLLGICLGHQALGLRSGATIALGLHRRGAEMIESLGPHPLLDGLGSQFSMDASHREGISLPHGFTCLARSQAYAVEAMADDQRHRYGVQFHPETSGHAGARLVGNFLDLAHLAS